MPARGEGDPAFAEHPPSHTMSLAPSIAVSFVFTENPVRWNSYPHCAGDKTEGVQGARSPHQPGTVGLESRPRSACLSPLPPSETTSSCPPDFKLQHQMGRRQLLSRPHDLMSPIPGTGQVRHPYVCVYVQLPMVSFSG